MANICGRTTITDWLTVSKEINSIRHFLCYNSSGGGGGAVASVFGRTGAVVAQANDYTFAQLASKPTTVAGYGITDIYPDQTGNSGKFLTTNGSVTSWATVSAGITGTMVSGRIPVGSGSSTLTTYSNLLYDGVNTITIGGGQIRDNGSNMRLIPSAGGLEVYNGTNYAINLYNGGGSDGIAMLPYARSISGITTKNISIGLTTPDASAMLDVQSTTLGFLPPRMTTTQKNAISSPAEGLVVYDTTLHKLYVRTVATWEIITSA